MEQEIIFDGNGGWMSQGYIDSCKKLYNKMERYLLYGYGDTPQAKERKIRNEDNRKWAWIQIGHTKKLVWVDNKTNKAYKADGYEKTWIEIKNFTFLRWATTFDL